MTAQLAQNQLTILQRERASITEDIALKQAHLPILDAQIASLEALIPKEIKAEAAAVVAGKSGK